MAILNSDLYQISLNVARKDKKGRAFTVKEFNRYLWFTSNNYYDYHYQQFRKKKVLPSPLEVFRVLAASVTVTTGVGSMPSTFFHLLGRPKWGAIPVAVLSDEQYNMKEDNAIMAPSSIRPACRIYYDSTNSVWKGTFYPAASFASQTVTIDYLKEPTQPILDYYIDTDGAYVFLDAAETHTVVSGEVFPLATTQPSVSSTYTSTTAEMLWEDVDKENLLYNVLALAGITIDRPDLAQYFDAQKMITIQTENN